MKLEESIEQILCGVNSNNTGLQVEELLKLFEKEKESGIMVCHGLITHPVEQPCDSCKKNLEEWAKVLEGKEVIYRKDILSDLTELEDYIESESGKSGRAEILAKLQEIKAKYKETEGGKNGNHDRF